VSLFSWSAGGAVAGGYLAQPDKQQNVANAVFLSSGFVPSEPPQPPYPTSTTGVSAFANFLNPFSLNPACAGQRDPNILAPFWSSARARDPIGASWGSTDRVFGGLVRWPTVIGWGWAAPEAARVTVPAMIISPLEDQTVLPNLQTSLYEELGSERKVIVRIDCGSHATAWEGSTNPSGWRGPHSTLQSAAVE
jgi:pimeloyl-ACP methyl ester carboxylesterase